MKLRLQSLSAYSSHHRPVLCFRLSLTGIIYSRRRSTWLKRSSRHASRSEWSQKSDIKRSFRTRASVDGRRVRSTTPGRRPHQNGPARPGPATHVTVASTGPLRRREARTQLRRCRYQLPFRGIQDD